jgi:hexosaminidase
VTQHDLIPAPQSLTPIAGERFTLTPASRVVIGTDAPVEAIAVAERLAAWLRRPTGFAVPVGARPGEGADVVLALTPDSTGGAEGYTLRADSGGSRITASTPAGLFRGATTLRQLLPAAAEADDVQPGPWVVGGVEVADAPRFEYRGTMLDVARHFFAVDDVLRYLDLLALYKVNALHLHLTDDQGWRLTVPGWPRLTEVGGASDIDGGPGGFYSPADYARIVTYAAERFIEVVPEIDGPGHTTAALRSYPELGSDGVAPPPFQHGGISEVSVSATADATYGFLGDVFDVLAGHPGRYIHVGGDEAIGTPREDFIAFVSRTAQLVADRGRTPVVWHEAAQATLPAGSVVQYWGTGQEEATDLAQRAVAQGSRLIVSPGNRAYLDMKYADDTPLGLVWAGVVPVSASYDWDPATLIDGVGEASILGVESALWSETTGDLAAVEYMAFPRLAGIAEIGWSPAAARRWDDYRLRLAAHGRRWDALGVNYFRAPEVPWSA